MYGVWCAEKIGLQIERLVAQSQRPTLFGVKSLKLEFFSPKASHKT
jgi:hypothetical protein